jgi:glycosyltransferase 2 family protein
MKNVRHTIFVLSTIMVVAGAISVTFYYKCDIGKLKMTLQTARWGFAPLAILVGLLVYPVKALRWRIILGPTQKVHYRTLLAAIMIGFMANCIISRLGELIRAAVMSIKGEMRTSTAIASIALERIFDIATVVLFLVLGLQWLEPSSVRSEQGRHWMSVLRDFRFPAAAGLAFAVAFLVLLRLYPQWMTGVLARFIRPLPHKIRGKVEGFLSAFLAGLDTLRSWRQVAAILFLSLVHWGIQVLFFLLAGYCFPDMAITVPGALLVFAITAIGVAGLPLPGYIGIYQAAVLGAGALIARGSEDAWFGYSWLAWALNIPFVVLVGFIFLWKENLSLGQIRKQTDVSKATTA